MLRPRSLCTALLVGFLSAAFLPAHAAVTYTVVATAEGGDLLDMLRGETLTIDVFVRSDADVSGETVFGLGASVFGYDDSLTYVSGVTSMTFFNQASTGPGTGFGGLPNLHGDTPDSERPNSGDEVGFLEGISIDGTPATGAIDISPITMVAGGPHARLIFTVNESATFGVGTSADYADAVVGDGGIYLDANNASITVRIVPDCDVPLPEPSVGWMLIVGVASLAGLARMRGQYA